MATHTLTEQVTLRPGPGRWRVPWMAIVLGLAVVGAPLPLLVLQAWRLWELPHYQFFPLVPLCAGVLARRDVGWLGPLDPGGERRARGLLAGCSASLATAALLVSPWLGAAAALGMMLGVAYAWGGGRLVRHLLPAWVFLWVSLPLPLGLDQPLISAMQSVASRWSSATLNVIGVVHVLSGHVIKVAGRDLLVEEACSGIHSFFAVLACTLFFVLLMRCSAPRTLALGLAATVWVLLDNVARIVVVAGCFTRWGIDLSEGRPHELLGLGVLCATLGMLASSDGVYRVLAGMCRRQGPVRVKVWRRSWNPVLGVEWYASWDRTAPTGPVTPQPAPDVDVSAVSAEVAAPRKRTRLPSLGRTALACWPVVVGFGALMVFQWVWLWPSLRVELTEGPALSARLQADLNPETMPAHWGLLKRQGFETKHRSRGGIEGEFSRLWSYRFGPHPAVVSVDFPFRDWHELTSCYRHQGWTLQERACREGARGPFVEADLTMPSARHGYLVFRLFDARARAIRPPDKPRPSEGVMSYLLGRLVPRRYLPGYTDQVQVFVESGRPLTAAEREQIRSFLEYVCDRVHPASPEGRRSAS